MKDMNDIVNELVEDIEIPDDMPVSYEVWATGYDEDGTVYESEMFITAFTDPDEAVAYAKELTSEDVLSIAAEHYVGAAPYENIEGISIEVETVVPNGDDGTMNVGTIYRKLVEIEESFEFVTLSNSEFDIMEDGNIQIPCGLLKEYNKNDCITIIFKDAEFSEHMTYKIISNTTSGYYICEFV